MSAELDWGLLADSEYVEGQYRARQLQDAAAYGLGVAKVDRGPTGALLDEAGVLSSDLRAYTRAAWPIIEPAHPFVPNWHLDAIAEHLSAVTSGEIKRLLINIPPRCMKSLSVSVLWMTWEWTRSPSVQWLFLTWHADLCTRDSLRCRRLILSPWYQERWGHLYQLSPDQQTKVNFENNRRGVRVAKTMGGSRGSGGDRIVCLPYHEPVLTDQGWLPIGQVVDGRLPVRVLSSSGNWQEIEKYERNPGRPCVRLRFSDGSTMTCTEDHRIWVEEAASFLPVRDLYSRHGHVHVRQLLNTPGSTREEGGTGEELLLFAEVLRGMAAWRAEHAMARRISAGAVPSLRRRQVREEGLRAQSQVLLSCMPHRMASGAAARGMRAVRSLLHSWREVLFSELRQQAPRSQDAWQGQPELHDWPVGNELRAWVHGVRAAQHPGAGPLAVRCVQEGWRDPSGSPHRPGPRGSQLAEPCDVVHLVPFEAAQAQRAGPPLGSLVALEDVERVETPDTVYNLRVTPDHDYYAGGVLVHNCDDPHNTESAESEVQRTAVLRDWNEEISTRHNDPMTGATVVMMQRLHQQDLTGEILDTAEKGEWEHLMLPMRFDPARRCVTSLGVQDNRTMEGEELWKERFPASSLEFRSQEKQLGPYGAAGQWQQEPFARKGGQFERAWFNQPDRYDKVPIGSKMIWVRAWDAAGTQDGGAYTCGLLMGLRITDGVIFVKHVVRGQWGAGPRNEVIKTTTEDDANAFGTGSNGTTAPNKRAVLNRFEQEPGSGGKDQAKAFIRLLAGYRVEAEPSSGDKFTRADPFSGAAKNGDVHVLPGPWREAYLDELEAAGPGAKYLDQMDCSSSAYNRLMTLWDKYKGVSGHGFNMAALDDESLEREPGWRVT